MKHLSLCLTVFALGAVPLTAAAFDYGPNRPLLAAEGGAPQLPSMDAPTGHTNHVAEASSGAGSLAPAADAAAQQSLPASSAPTRPGPSASNRAPRAHAGTTPAEPHPAPWQSLLPGSIQ